MKKVFLIIKILIITILISICSCRKEYDKIDIEYKIVDAECYRKNGYTHANIYYDHLYFNIIFERNNSTSNIGIKCGICYSKNEYPNISFNVLEYGSMNSMVDKSISIYSSFEEWEKETIYYWRPFLQSENKEITIYGDVQSFLITSNGELITF